MSVHFVGLGSFTRGREGSSSPRVNEKPFTREFFPNLIFRRVNDTRCDFEHTRKPSENHLLVFSKRLLTPKPDFTGRTEVTAADQLKGDDFKILRLFIGCIEKCLSFISHSFLQLYLI